jgi:hypothetical protein
MAATLAWSGRLAGLSLINGPLAAHLRYAERASRKLARATFYGMARWQGRLEHKQGFLGRIVDIGAELFAISAVCVRAQLDATAGSGTERGAAAPELADLFCAQARLRAEELFSQLWSNTDTADSASARRVLAGRYSWLEDGIIDPSIPGPWIAPAEPGHPRRGMSTATSAEAANRPPPPPDGDHQLGILRRCRTRRRRTSRSATHARFWNPQAGSRRRFLAQEAECPA